VDFVIARNSKQLENTAFRKQDLFPSSGDGKENADSVGSLRKRHPQSPVHKQVPLYKSKDIREGDLQ
jgi:hypothetical protein